MIRITNKKSYKEFVEHERKIYGMKRPIIFRPAFSEKQLIWKYVSILRKCELYENTNKKIRLVIFKYLKNKIRLKTGFSIKNNVCDIGLRINHLGIIHLSADRVGKNCTIAGTCYVIKSGFSDRNAIIGDNVFIGMNSIIIGGITIGNNCLIGAGAIVTKDFAEDKLVIAGVPAKVLKKNIDWVNETK